MSTEALKWVIESAPPFPPHLFGTLAGLAYHADGEGKHSFPSVPTLAAYACKADRSVRRDLRELQELDLIRSGDPAKVAHIPVDRRPEIYDLATDRVVPGGRAGDDEVTWASARTLASSRARGGKEKPSSEPSRGDVHVRADVDVRADAHVPATGRPRPSDRTPTSAKPKEEPKEETKERAEKSPPPVRADVERVCKHLADRLVATGSKRPTIDKKWRDSARLLLDKDGITVDQAVKAIDWALANDFWQAHILTPTKLRAKYETLRRQAQAEQQKHGLAPRQSTPAEELTPEELRAKLRFG